MPTLTIEEHVTINCARENEPDTDATYYIRSLVRVGFKLQILQRVHGLMIIDQIFRSFLTSESPIEIIFLTIRPKN